MATTFFKELTRILKARSDLRNAFITKTGKDIPLNKSRISDLADIAKTSIIVNESKTSVTANDIPMGKTCYVNSENCDDANKNPLSANFGLLTGTLQATNGFELSIPAANDETWNNGTFERVVLNAPMHVGGDVVLRVDPVNNLQLTSSMIAPNAKIFGIAGNENIESYDEYLDAILIGDLSLT